MSATCEHGIRQPEREGLPTAACRCGCHGVPNGKPEIEERPVDWPWLYGRERES